jgi:glycerophosphoryl diester phosphodiesterase
MFGPNSGIRAIGHRGAAGIAPENTIEAIEHALAGGADAIELDVHVATCGTLVAIHDDTLDRTTDGSGSVERLDLQQIQVLDAGFRFTPDRGLSNPYRGTGVRVPTLDEAAEAAGKLPMIIEVKSPRAGHALGAWLSAREDRDRFLVGGFDRVAVAPAAAAAQWQCATRQDLKPFALLGKLGLSPRVRPEITAFMVPVRKGALRIVTHRFVRRAHDLGIGVYVWTVNRPADIRALLDLGVDGLISDVPARVRRIAVERSAAPAAEIRAPKQLR